MEKITLNDLKRRHNELQKEAQESHARIHELIRERQNLAMWVDRLTQGDYDLLTGTLGESPLKVAKAALALEVRKQQESPLGLL